jgi:hypothetical protein
MKAAFATSEKGLEEVALLVLACQSPRTLEALAGNFSESPFRIFVHLDAKIPLVDYSRERAWPSNLTFIEQRFEVFWAGFNMIRATEALARSALRDGGCRIVALVSDDTLPLLPAGEIHRHLVSLPNRIDVAMSRRNPPFLRRYTEFFFMDSPATNARPVDIQNRSFDAASLGAIQRLAGLRERGKFPLPEVWGGSQWWTLERRMLEAILDDLSEDPWLRESFEFSAVPDELAFQTLYANRIGLTARSFTGPMLTDVTRNPVPFVFRSLDELPAVPAGKLFLRKIADDAAGSMMRELESRWNNA